jgi:hypothetical protein
MSRDLSVGKKNRFFEDGDPLAERIVAHGPRGVPQIVIFGRAIVFVVGIQPKANVDISAFKRVPLCRAVIIFVANGSGRIIALLREIRLA